LEEKLNLNPRGEILSTNSTMSTFKIVLKAS
jgi:hypothetical protein